MYSFICPYCNKETNQEFITIQEMASLSGRFISPLAFDAIPLMLVPHGFKCSECNLGTVRSAEGKIVFTSKEMEGYEKFCLGIDINEIVNN